MNGTGNCERRVFLPSLCVVADTASRLTVFNAPPDSRNYILVSSAPESAAAHTVMDLPWHRVSLQRVFVDKQFRKGADLCLSQESPRVFPKALGSLFKGLHWSLCSCRSPLCWHSCEEQLPSACYVILLMPSAFVRSQERVNRITGSREKELTISILFSGFFYFKNC